MTKFLTKTVVVQAVCGASEAETGGKPLAHVTCTDHSKFAVNLSAETIETGAAYLAEYKASHAQQVFEGKEVPTNSFKGPLALSGGSVSVKEGA